MSRSLGQPFIRTWIGKDMMDPSNGQFSITSDGQVLISHADANGNDETDKIVPDPALYLDFVYWKITLLDTGGIIATANLKPCDDHRLILCSPPVDPYLVVGMTYNMNLKKTKMNGFTYGCADVFILLVAAVFFIFLFAAGINFMVVHARRVRRN